MKEQICDISKLYKGTTEDFNTVDYLSKIVRLRSEFRDFIEKKNLVQFSKEGKHNILGSKFYEKPNCFPDQRNRIAKNGAITVEFYNGVPYKFYTPFGMIPVHDCDNVWHNKAFKQLEKKYGLIQVGTNQNTNTQNPIYAVTKMPEIKKSILPWRKKHQAIPEEKLPMPTESYSTIRPNSDQFIDDDLARSPEYYEKYYKDKQYMSPEYAREKENLQKAFDVVNVKSMQDNHPEYIMPNTGHEPRIYGIRYSLKYYLKKFPDALAKFETALKEDDAKNVAMAEEIKAKYQDDEAAYRINTFIDKQSTMEVKLDQGREI